MGSASGILSCGNSQIAFLAKLWFLVRVSGTEKTIHVYRLACWVYCVCVCVGGVFCGWLEDNTPDVVLTWYVS